MASSQMTPKKHNGGQSSEHLNDESLIRTDSTGTFNVLTWIQSRQIEIQSAGAPAIPRLYSLIIFTSWLTDLSLSLGKESQEKVDALEGISFNGRRYSMISGHNSPIDLVV